NLGPVVSAVDHRPHMRMAAIDGTRSRLAGAPLTAVIACRGRQIVLEMRDAARSRVGNKVWIVRIGLIPEMAIADHAGRSTASPIAAAVCHEELADFVEGEPPLVAAAVREDFKFPLHRMITPDTGAESRPLFPRGARLADLRSVEDPLVSVEPAVRSP